jgi:hypothetical protein
VLLGGVLLCAVLFGGVLLASARVTPLQPGRDQRFSLRADEADD